MLLHHASLINKLLLYLVIEACVPNYGYRRKSSQRSYHLYPISTTRSHNGTSPPAHPSPRHNALFDRRPPPRNPRLTLPRLQAALKRARTTATHHNRPIRTSLHLRPPRNRHRLARPANPSSCRWPRLLRRSHARRPDDVPRPGPARRISHHRLAHAQAYPPRLRLFAGEVDHCYVCALWYQGDDDGAYGCVDKSGR